MSSVLLVWTVLGMSAGCSRLEPANATTPAEPAKPHKQLSEAERIAQTERMLEDAKKDLAAAEAELANPESDYATAEAEFKALDTQLQTAKKTLAKLRAAKQNKEAAEAEASLKTLTGDWERARDRFNLLIAQRKSIQEKKMALASQIEKYQQSLAALKNPPPPTVATKTDNPPASAPGTPPTPPATTQAPAPAAVPGVPGAPAVPATAKSPAPAPAVKDDAEIRAARAAAEARKAALAEAEDKAKSVEDRVAVLGRLIATEEKLLAAERKVADQAESELSHLTGQINAVPPAERPAILAKMSANQQRLGEARDRIAKQTDRIAALNDDLRAVQEDRIEALKVIDAKKKEAADADEAVTQLQNPLAMRNINKWLASHGVNMVLILVGIFALHIVVRQSSRQIVQFVSRNSDRGSEEDRENRASTLVGVFRYATTLVIFGGGIVMLLDEAGVPVVPLMGGAAVMGLAVAFGAQNLIKDYFTGFMMLLEDQYSVNDVVRIGTIAGRVEKITLRVTVLRDLEGVLHFIPHGQVTAISNMTHGWSRALFDIPVPHAADLTYLMDELMLLAKNIAHRPGVRGKDHRRPGNARRGSGGRDRERRALHAEDAAPQAVGGEAGTAPPHQAAVRGTGDRPGPVAGATTADAGRRGGEPPRRPPQHLAAALGEGVVSGRPPRPPGRGGCVASRIGQNHKELSETACTPAGGVSRLTYISLLVSTLSGSSGSLL